MLLLLALLLAAPVDLDGVVRLMGANNFAHACPIVGGYLVTSAHVSQDMRIARWSDGLGNEGLAERLSIVDGADLALLKVMRGTLGRAYRLAAQAPAPGERIVLRAYRLDSPRSAMAERRLTAKVTRVEAGHVFFEESGTPGSSGSCVFNLAGEVIAINKGGIVTEIQKRYAGQAVGVWGAWGRFDKESE